MKPAIAITIGDFNGIGPELAIAAATHASVRRVCQPILVGPLDVFRHSAKLLRKKLVFTKTAFPFLVSQGIPVLDVGDAIWADVTFGAPSKASGKTAGIAIEKAVDLCVHGKTVAMVTAPTSKEGLHMAGYNFPGQTEMVTLLSRSQKVIMMLVSPTLRVGLVTIHIGLKEVAEQVSKEKIVEKLKLLDGVLKKDFGIAKPRIAVLGLNPHAGENGHIGPEEKALILPALEEARSASINASGPFPADAFFGTKAHTKYDTVLAMYHDQGLIPLKLLGFGKSVNVSAGLAIVRTSPDHGTAYDIAGKGKASVSSMIEAVRLAADIAHRRAKATS